MSEIVMYQTPDNLTQSEVRFEEDTVWLSQQQMAALFQQTKQNISLHINNCFKEKELVKESVVKESLTTATDGKNYNVSYYNLDVIISVGYRVKSPRGTQFRQWATTRLRDYLVEGYAVNQWRLEERNLEIKELKDGIGILRRAIIMDNRSLERPLRLPPSCIGMRQPFGRRRAVRLSRAACVPALAVVALPAYDSPCPWGSLRRW